MSQWRDLVTASLIGTERVPVPVAAIPGLPPLSDAPPGNSISDITISDNLVDAAGELLDRAALLAAARRAGRLAEEAEPLAVAEADPGPVVSPAAGRRLARIIGGENPDLLAEWLTAAIARGLRAPARLLPALLDRARRVSSSDPQLRRLAVQAGGSRARWLAGLNPDWKFAAAPVLTGEDAWRLGDNEDRRSYLAALCAADPGAARELIAADWDAAGRERIMFLSVLADGPGGLSLADELLLEAALDDRADEVRGWAAYLLSIVPGSALGDRMAERARGYVRLDRSVRGPRLFVYPPGRYDDDMWRDGVTPGRGAGGAPLADGARVVLSVVSRAPLRVWTDEFRMPAAKIVAVRSGDWAPVLFSGWARAAMAQRDQDWMAALITEALTGRPPEAPTEMAVLRQLAREADPVLGAPGTLPDPEPGAPAALYDTVGVLRFRHDMLKELEHDHGPG